MTSAETQQLPLRNHFRLNFIKKSTVVYPVSPGHWQCTSTHDPASGYNKQYKAAFAAQQCHCCLKAQPWQGAAHCVDHQLQTLMPRGQLLDGQHAPGHCDASSNQPQRVAVEHSYSHQPLQVAAACARAEAAETPNTTLRTPTP